MLDEAERLWGEEKPALAAIMLSYAAQFMLRGQEAVFFGNFIQTSDLQKSFRRARGFSSKLIKAFRRKSCSETPFFAQLMELRHAPRKHIDFVLAKRRYNMFLGKLRTMQDIIRDSCEQHLFYLEHGKTKSQMEAEAAAQTTADMSGSELLGTDDTAVGVEPVANLGADTTGRPGVGTETDEKQGISIHVDPTIAVIALGLAKGCLPGMLEQLESQSGLRMEDDRRQQMIDTLDEIYNRCIEKSDIREVVDMYLKAESKGTVS